MSETTIKCPKCGANIELTEAFTHQIEEQVRRGFALDLDRLKQQHQTALQAKDKEAAEALAVERKRIEDFARKQAAEASQTELKDLKQQLADRAKQLEESRQQELGLRKRQREVEEQARNQELELARKLDAERETIRKQASEKSAQETQLKLREKDLLLEQMRTQIEELKKRSEQGPQERQGEVQELELEDMLRQQFPLDDIQPVKKGERGADILQKVQNRLGQPCGAILWESKRAKNWSDGWIAKLKDDQRAAHADVAVIATAVLPDEHRHFGQKDGVWVVEFPLACLLGVALRETVLQVAGARQSLTGMNEKKDVLYNYLSSPQFRQRIEGIVEAFKTMKEDLDAEKRAMERQWAKREKQIERVITNTSAMYGDLQGIIGKELPAVKTLELPGRE